MVLLAATRSMAMQGAKLRVPSIKFRYGHQAGNQPSNSPAPVKQTTAAPQASAPSPAASGAQQLPARFWRQDISEEEIEYINRGGPA